MFLSILSSSFPSQFFVHLPLTPNLSCTLSFKSTDVHGSPTACQIWELLTLSSAYFASLSPSLSPLLLGSPPSILLTLKCSLTPESFNQSPGKLKGKREKGNGNPRARQVVPLPVLWQGKVGFPRSSRTTHLPRELGAGEGESLQLGYLLYQPEQ